MLSTRASEALRTDEVGVSPITFWEIAMLAAKARIHLDRPAAEWLRDGLPRSSTATLALTPEIAARAGAMNRDPIRDPADRIIVATALHHGASLVTKDGRIIAANVVATIW
jgi:PIN domain nuclease of toxin-antitoxin system